MTTTVHKMDVPRANILTTQILRASSHQPERVVEELGKIRDELTDVIAVENPELNGGAQTEAKAIMGRAVERYLQRSVGVLQAGLGLALIDEGYLTRKKLQYLGARHGINTGIMPGYVEDRQLPWNS